MKTLYLTRGSNIVVDTDDNTANRLDTTRSAIDRIYYVKEPMHVVYGYGEVHEELDVKKGDILVVFYDSTFKHQIIVAKSKQWVENILDYEKREQEEKEKWAAKKLTNCTDCGETCESPC